ncbi:MAG: DUF6789 family protein, partial [Acidimicrobiia bacterium]
VTALICNDERRNHDRDEITAPCLTVEPVEPFKENKLTFDVLAALIAGLAGTLVMTAMMTLAASAGLTQMPPMTLVAGSMMSEDPERAKRFGVMIHYIVMGTVVFGIVYAALFAGLGSAAALTGALIGAVHGIVVGAMAMPMMPAIHPRMTSSGSAARQPAVDITGGAVVLSAPGIFGSRWGAVTPIALVVGHVVYGVVAALAYSSLV